jgi:YVTN family beta-propeller protein
MGGSSVPVWDPVSDRVYVSCQTEDRVAVVDAKGDSILTHISVGACPMKMYLNTVGRKLYVQNYDAGTVSIIDLTNDHVIKTLNVGGNPNAGYYCPGADKFYSAGPIRQCVVIGGQSDTIIARVPLPGDVEVISATGSKNGGLVYLGTYDGGVDDYVATVSTTNDSLLASVVVGGGPGALACYPGSGLVYCATWGGQVFVLSSDGVQVLDTLQVGWYPFVFAQAPCHNRLYLGHLGSSYVYVLSDTSAGVAEKQLWSVFESALRASPNPFTRSVTLAWNSPRGDGGVVRVYAQDGRLVRQARIHAGQDKWVWNGRDGAGASAPPGVYVVETGAGGRRKIIKLHQ